VSRAAYTGRFQRLFSQYAAMPTTNAMPAFHTASAPLTMRTKRSPLSFRTSHAPSASLRAGQEEKYGFPPNEASFLARAGWFGRLGLKGRGDCSSEHGAGAIYSI
jgi:hypothetical protein